MKEVKEGLFIPIIFFTIALVIMISIPFYHANVIAESDYHVVIKSATGEIIEEFDADFARYSTKWYGGGGFVTYIPMGSSNPLCNHLRIYVGSNQIVQITRIGVETI